MSVLNEVEAAFLAESDALAGSPAVDYRNPDLCEDDGHAAAWLLLKGKAQAKAPLALGDVLRVLSLLPGHPTLPCDAQARLGDALSPPLGELATRIDEAGPALDFHGGHTFVLAGSFLQRFLALALPEPEGRASRLDVEIAPQDPGLLQHAAGETRDGRLARLVCNYILVRRNWSMVIFHKGDRDRLEAERHSAALLGAYLVERVREHASCGHCRVGQVVRTQVGLSTDAYRCGDCGAEFKLDWKGLQTAYKRALAPQGETASPAGKPSRFILRTR